MNLKKWKLNKNTKVKLKCLFTLFLVFTMVISFIPNINIFANESYEYVYTGSQNKEPGYVVNVKLPSGGNAETGLFQVKHSKSERTSKAYCTDSATLINTDTSYSIVNIEDSEYYDDYTAGKIRAILRNSYPFIGIGDIESKFGINVNSKDAITATQLAIWHYSNRITTYPGLSDSESNAGANNENIANLYNRLISLPGEEASVPIAKIISKQPIISQNGNNIDIEFIFKIDGNNVDGSSIALNYKVDGVDSYQNQISREDRNGFTHIKITNIKLGTKFKFTISGVQDIGKDVFFYKPQDGRNKSQSLLGEQSGNINISEIFEYDYFLKELEVTKVDKDNNDVVLQGAEFEIKNSSNEVVDVITTDREGKASIKLLPGTYTIKEIKAPEGYKISDSEEQVFTINKNTPEKITFTFNNEKLIIPTEITLNATKKLTGKTLEEDMFTFKVYEGNNVVASGTNAANGSIQFTPITYNTTGSHIYTVKEVEGNLGGVEYDESTFEIKVDVTRTTAGNLVATREDLDGEVIFENIYEAEPIEVELEGIKKLTGKDLEANMFSFKLFDSDGEWVETVKNNERGRFKFSKLEFNEVGTYTYEIVEVNERLGGMTYDSQVVDVIIEVTDNGNGQLEASVSYPLKKLEFNNSYKTGTTGVSIQGTKKLIGKDLESGMFSFELLDKDNNILQVVKNSAKGKIQFSDITYDEAGTYKYKVREFNGNLAGISYDESEFNVTVNVTDDGKGNLEAEVVYPEGGVVFNNSYEAESTSEAIEATKTLTGTNLEAGMFSFELVDKDNPDNVLQTVENSADGKVQFEAITYDKVGDYKYIVREVKDTLSGIIYDKNEFEVTVKVTDDGKGNLESKVIYPEGGVSFNNTVIKGKLEFTKTDVSTGKVIDGAKIKITCTEGLDKGEVIEFTSSKEGNKFELKAGKYTFEETQAPEGYELTTEVGTFEIKENGEVVKAELKNYPIKGSAKLIKVDKDDNEKRIKGAKFVLLSSDKETIIAEDLVTDSEGNIIVSNLEPGTYYFKEIEAASGYILDDRLIEVKVESNQQTIATVTFENEKEEEGGGLPDVDPEGEGGYPDTDSNVSSPNTNNNTNTNTNTNVNTNTNSSVSSPKTSDTSITAYAIGGIVAVGALAGINRKRKDK